MLSSTNAGGLFTKRVDKIQIVYYNIIISKFINEVLSFVKNLFSAYNMDSKK